MKETSINCDQIGKVSTEETRKWRTEGPVYYTVRYSHEGKVEILFSQKPRYVLYKRGSCSTIAL